MMITVNEVIDKKKVLDEFVFCSVCFSAELD